MEDQSNQQDTEDQGSIFDLPSLLLDGMVEKNPDWETNLAPKKIFYIRGYSWFRESVGSVTSVSQDSQANLVKEMLEIVNGRSEWSRHANIRENDFSFRLQVAEALGAGRACQKLQKALGTLGVCEAFLKQQLDAGKTNVTVKQMYERMHIQPACFYISNFTSQLIETAREVDSKFLSKLEEETGQLRHSVFHEMALTESRSGAFKRSLVTRELAEGVADALKKMLDADDRLQALDPGRVSCVYDASVKGQKASKNEHIRF